MNEPMSSKEFENLSTDEKLNTVIKSLANTIGRVSAVESILCSLFMTKPELINMPDLMEFNQPEAQEHIRMTQLAIAQWVMTTYEALKNDRKQLEILTLKDMFES